MRPAALLLALLLLVPSAAAQADFDRAQEVRDGAPVHLHLEFSARGGGSRQGEDQGQYAVSEEVSYRVEWGAPVHLLPYGAPDGELVGAILSKWNASASRTYVWDFEGGSKNKRHEEWTCSMSGSDRMGGRVQGRLEGDRLRLTLSGAAAATLREEDACSWWQEDTTIDGVQRRDGTRDFSKRIPILPFLRNDSFHQSFDVVVPLEGRTSVPIQYSESVPAPEYSAERMYCGFGNSHEWATGTCSAQGTLTVHVWVDPCKAIERRLVEKVARLSQVQGPPSGADEAAVAAWAAGVHPQVEGVLSDARAYLLVCGEDLPADPWGAIVRAQRLHRDALLAIAREGGLSPEGTATVLGVERSLQLMGVDDGIDLSGLGPASPPPAGTFEVSVHSPVSLHVWSEDGGHVGWNATTNTSESTIPGATYEGAPGGEQRIVLPAGFYRVTVDELEHGAYLLDINATGEGSAANEAWLVRAQPGRTTTTHYAVVSREGELALQTFPVHRTSTATAGSPPPLVGGTSAAGEAPTGDSPTGGAPASGPTPEEGAQQTPGPGALLVALAAIGAARVGRRGGRT